MQEKTYIKSIFSLSFTNKLVSSHVLVSSRKSVSIFLTVMTRCQKRHSDDGSDEDTVSPKRLCQSDKGERVTTTVTVKSPEIHLVTIISPDHDSVTMAQPDCNVITFSVPAYDTVTSQLCDSVTLIDPYHTAMSQDYAMVTSPDHDMVTVTSSDHDKVTVTSSNQCTQGRIYKMKAPPPSTLSSLVSSQVVNSGTSSSDRSIMSITTRWVHLIKNIYTVMFFGTVGKNNVKCNIWFWPQIEKTQVKAALIESSSQSLALYSLAELFNHTPSIIL